jgi:hypothetical protein
VTSKLNFDDQEGVVLSDAVSLLYDDQFLVQVKQLKKLAKQQAWNEILISLRQSATDYLSEEYNGQFYNRGNAFFVEDLLTCTGTAHADDVIGRVGEILDEETS